MRIEIAGGTVVGAHHRAAGRNNQDAYAWTQRDEHLVAVVSDGCGSGAHSEVGAKLGARLFCDLAVALCGQGLAVDVLLDLAAECVLKKLRALGLDATEHFLFTLVGLVVDDDVASTFSLGDGLVVSAGARDVLGPFAGNAPPYLGHALGGIDRRFVVHRTGRVDDVLPVALGTDGATELEVDALLADARTFKNSDHVRRKLTVLSRRPGALLDDTTLVLARVQP